MTDMLPTRQYDSRCHQRGAALIVGLVVLLIVTLLGVSTMSSSGLELRMSGNALEKTVSFENAEDVRMIAESMANSVVERMENSSDNARQAAAQVGLNKGFYDRTVGSNPSVDAVEFWNDTGNYMQVGGAGSGYALEYLGVHALYLNRQSASAGINDTLMHVFRITTIGQGADGARTALQAVYMRH